MPFDPKTAAPIEDGFDPSSAVPVADARGASNGARSDSSSEPQDFDPVAFRDAMFNQEASHVSTPVKLLAGVGQGLADTTRGIYQLGASLGHAMGLVSDEKMAQIQQNVDYQHEAEQPLTRTTAGKIGDVVGTAIPALAMPEAGILGSAAEGAGIGAIQPVPTGQSRAQNVVTGAAGGAGGATAGKLIGGVLGGFGGSGGRQAAVDLLDKEGVPVSVAQATGSKLAQTIERASGITSGAPADFAAEQGAAFNRAVLRRIGVTNPEVTAATPDVLGPAKDAITSTMDAVAARTKPTVDNIFLSNLAQVEQDATRQLPASDIGPITKNINDILENAAQNNGALDGTFVRKLNSNLGALSRNPSTAPIASDLQEAVNDAVHRYATPGDAELLNTARRQFRALKQIEPAVDPATGNISVPKLMTSLNSKGFGGRNQTLYGRGDQSLIDLAKAAKSVIPDNLGNSGTAERALPLATALEVAASGEPVKAALKAGIGTVGLNAAGKAMRSQGVIGSFLKSGIPGARATVPAISKAAAPIGIGAAESQPHDTTRQYAKGGKVDHEVLVSRLMDRWHAARKAANKTTEPLLQFPDETIAKALEIAGRPAA